jgi:hypothetical protein
MFRTFFVLVLLLGCVCAFGGHYQPVSITGGQFQNLDGPTPYHGTAAAGYGGGISGAFGTASGTITATFAWVKDGDLDTAPAKVLVYEACEIEANAARPG